MPPRCPIPTKSAKSSGCPADRLRVESTGPHGVCLTGRRVRRSAATLAGPPAEDRSEAFAPADSDDLNLVRRETSAMAARLDCALRHAIRGARERRIAIRQPRNEAHSAARAGTRRPTMAAASRREPNRSAPRQTHGQQCAHSDIRYVHFGITDRRRAGPSRWRADGERAAPGPSDTRRHHPNLYGRWRTRATGAGRTIRHWATQTGTDRHGMALIPACS
jgi:hypothetical protein